MLALLVQCSPGSSGDSPHSAGAPSAGAGGSPTPGGGATTSAGASAAAGASAGSTPLGGAISSGGSSGAGSGSIAGASGAGSGGSGGVVEPPLGAWPPPALKLTPIADAKQPVAIAAARGDASRLYVLEKAGRVRVIKDGVLLPDAALDINERVLEGDPAGGSGDKRGAIAIAFHPSYVDNGRLFILYAQDLPPDGNTSSDEGDMVLEEYARSSNPDVFEKAAKSTIVTIEKGSCSTCYQHNGGSLEIGSDGQLYLSMGDPPPFTDAGAEDPNSLLGKILRYDISDAEVKPSGNYPNGNPAVWSIGLRNPYKFSFDRVTGYMFIGDVGEDSWEEISIQGPADAHQNFGWPKREGKHNYKAGDCAGCIEPIAEHGHDNSDNAVIGGMVYRGSRIPSLAGTYLYGDNGSGTLRALQVKSGVLVNGPLALAQPKVRAACFGQDDAGELYVCGYSEGKVFRFDAN